MLLNPDNTGAEPSPQNALAFCPATVAGLPILAFF